MQITADYIDSMLVKAERVGRNNRRDEQELKNISRQLIDSVSHGNYKLKRVYDQPLNDNVLLPFCEARHVTVKASISKYVLQNITKYEYTFIYQGNEDIESVC